MKAPIGLLMLAGTCHVSRLHLADIWTPGGTGIEVIRLAMSLHRLHLLLCCQWLDSKEKCKESKVDKLAPVREIFEMFGGNGKNDYTPSENVTIDEMPATFIGHCLIRQYIPPKKPNMASKYMHVTCGLMPGNIQMGHTRLTRTTIQHWSHN